MTPAPAMPSADAGRALHALAARLSQGVCLPLLGRRVQAPAMFAVDEAAAHAIRQACQDGGELSGVVELRRRFPGIADNARARLCLEAIMN